MYAQLTLKNPSLKRCEVLISRTCKNVLQIRLLDGERAFVVWLSQGCGDGNITLDYQGGP